MQGFRAKARSILDEVLGFRPDFIEHQPGRGPSRDGFEGRGLDRRDQLIRIRGSGTELAVEGLIDEGAQPGADVEVPLGAEALETLTGFGRDADMKWNTVQHKTHHNT